MSDRFTRATAPTALLALLLVTATSFEGAFDIRHWGPVALFALVLLAATFLAGGARPVSGPVKVALAAIWAFAGWTLLSAAWAESPALAWEGGAIAIFYAALATVALVAVPAPRQMNMIGAGVIGGVVVLALVTLLRMHAEGSEMFVAGRLDSPVGYRNATATLFALAFWPLIGLAVTRGRNPSLRAAAFASAVLCLGLAFITQSRGVILALAAGGVVALILGTERIRRAFLGALALGGVLVLSGPLLIAYRTFEHGPGPVTAGDIASATNALTFLVVDAFIVGLVLALLDGGLRASVDNLARARRIAVVGLAIGAVGLFAGAVLAAGNPIDFAEEKLGEFQAVESRSADFSRILSTGGQRYDLWRVAVDEFLEAPVTGKGEGSYAFAYYAERDTDRNLSNPHSLPLRLLAELGLVGILLFVTFVAALAVALARGVRGRTVLTRHAIAGLAAAGTVVLVQSMVDWIWFVPGVMGIGLFCMSLAAGIASPRPLPGAVPSPSRTAGGGAGRSPLGAVGRAVARARAGTGWRAPRAALASLRAGLPLAGLGAAALAVLAVFLSDYFVREARTARSADAALAAAERAADVNPWAVTPLYLEAATLEDEGDVEGARAALEQALALEPRNFATLGLIGDIAMRSGDDAAADWYARAAELNPRDVGLEELAEKASRKAGDQVDPAADPSDAEESWRG